MSDQAIYAITTLAIIASVAAVWLIWVGRTVKKLEAKQNLDNRS